MTLVELIESEDERTSQELAAIEPYVPKSDELSSAAPARVRKGQHLDVDGILARSLPNPGAFSASDVKAIGLR
jgi:hypothetical protein